MNGVSKKLTITGLCIMAMMTLAQSDPNTDKLGYCIVIGVVALAYLAKQTLLDWKGRRQQ